jgi:hypothetical protein
VAQARLRFSTTDVFVMAGLVPAIHALLAGQGVDARHKAGHDDEKSAWEFPQQA